MGFEYDPVKSRLNEEKHGIDFEEAKRLWDDEHLLTTIIKHKREKRRFLISFYAGCCWSAIYTIRHRRIRIISVRKATPKEVEYYDRRRNEG